MSQQPNALLILIFQPTNSPEEVYNEILDKYGNPEDDIEIENEIFRVYFSNGISNEYSVSAPKDSIVFFNHITYGYEKKILFEDLLKIKESLEAFGNKIQEEFEGKHSIYVSANYW